MHLQKLLKEHDQDLTQGAFVMATQNEDLAILKLLVEHARPKRSNGDDIELSQMNQSNWKEWLFGPENVFLPSALAKDSDFAKYLKEEFKEEIDEILKSDQNTTDGDTSQSDELADAKALYELQSQEGSLENNLILNISLKLLRNVELTLLNHRSTISKDWDLYSKKLHKFILQQSDINSIYQIIEKCPKFKNELINFLSTTDLRVSNIKPEDVNIKLDDDDDRSSPLHLAAKEGSTELVKVLFSKGANLEAKDNDGW